MLPLGAGSSRSPSWSTPPPAGLPHGSCRVPPGASFVLDKSEQATHARSPAKGGGPVHYGDRGSQYPSIRYSGRVGGADIAPSVGSVGNAYDNALAEMVMGLFRTKVIRRRGSWRSPVAEEIATPERVDRLDHRRLLGPIGDIPPAEAGEQN